EPDANGCCSCRGHFLGNRKKSFLFRIAFVLARLSIRPDTPRAAAAQGWSIHLMANPKITFIGAGSSVFMKNIVGDILQRPALAGATIRLMDINPQRLEESEIIAQKLVASLGVPARVEAYSNQRQALEG